MEKLFRQIGDEIREYTDEEYAQHELDKIEAKKLADEKAAMEKQRADLLAKLNLTADEAKLLLS